MVKLLKFLLFFALSAMVFCAPTKNSLWKNVKALNELFKVLQSNPNVQKGVSTLQHNLKRAAATGIVLGTVNVEKQMELNILKLMSEFYRNLQKSNIKAATKNMKEMEKTMERDKHALEILRSALQLTMKTKSVKEYQKDLNKVASDDASSKQQKNEKNEKLKKSKEINKKTVNEFQSTIQSHLKSMRDKVKATVQETLKRMESKKKLEIGSTSPAITSPATHMDDIFNRDIVRLPHFHVQMPAWPVYQIDVESFYRFRRQNVDEKDGRSESENQVKESENDEEDFEFAPAPPASNGGIAGLIGSLSGGDGGSDVGALVGAISGIVTNLFGPGGLDVPSLLSTGTSLIAGLLGGDENFGKVLASYIGLAVDGLSGGGGADNNGAFFGNFVGTLLAQLSADPEEESGPQPKLFFDNFFKGFAQSKQKRGTDETMSNPKGYFFEFISNIISSLVGGVTNLILNASLGSSGGSSQGSADLSAGSSQGSSAGSASASKTSSMGSMQPEHKPDPK